MAREPTHVLEVRRALGRYLAACRQRAHWSQSKLASETHYHRTAISHLEAGRHPAPREFWEKADRLLAASGALLKQYDELVTTKHDFCVHAVHKRVDDAGGDPVLAAPWNHRGTVSAGVALHCDGDGIVKRRRFTMLAGAALTVPAHQWLIRESEPVVACLSGRRISVTLIDQLSVMITTLRTMDDATGGGTVLSLAQHTFDWVVGLLDHASYDEPTGRRLHTALAEIGQLAGWVAHDAGQPGLGQRYHIAALHAARSADDWVLGAHILGCMADQAARRGSATEAVTLIESAMAGIRGRETPRLLAELYIRKAYALASLQDKSACTTAVAKARTQIDHFAPDSDPRWLYWVTPAEITAGAGDCLLQLGQPAQATVLLDEGIAMFDESFARDRLVYLAHLADALSRPGRHRDLDAAADRGITAVRLAEHLASSRGIDCLRDLYAQMRAHEPAPAVRNFLERARVLLAA